MDFAELRDISATWLCGFLPMPQVDEGDPSEQRSVRTLLRANKQSYGTVLSLKFPYTGKPIPTPAMQTELRRPRAAGVRLPHGGGVVERCTEPTVLLDVPESAAVWHEEIFAPVVAVRLVPEFDRVVGLNLAGTFAVL